MIISYLALAVGLVATLLVFRLAFRLFQSDRIEGQKSAARSASVLDAVLGRAVTREDWLPDARVKGGMVYNRKQKRLEITGRLSPDSLDRVFRQKHC